MNRKEMLISSGVLAGMFFASGKKIFSQSKLNFPELSSLNTFNIAEVLKTNAGISLDEAIEMVIKQIEKKSYPNKLGGGGAIFFPPGIWEIKKTIKLPARTLLFGMGGFFHQQGIYSDGFYKKQHTVLKLKKNSNCNIIEPKEPDTPGIQIKGIVLDGNKKEQNGNGNFSGIYLYDITGKNNLEGIRSNLSVRDVMIYNCKGDGFYAGRNQNEFRLENVLSSKNNGNGFLFKGTDILLSNVWAGDNNKNGIHINGGGAVSTVNCDSWGNKLNGVLIDNYSQNNTFNRLQCNLNAKNGLKINGGINSTVFLGSIFKQNSKILGGSFSVEFANVSLNPVKNNSPKGIKFIGCQFGEGNSKTPSTTYGLEDNSEKIFPNSIIGCSFATNEFAEENVNEKVFKRYVISDCTTGPFGGEKRFFNNHQNFIEIKNNYKITPYDKIISVDTKSKQVNLELPSLKKMPVGTEIKIIKKYSNNYYILTPQNDEKLQNITNNQVTVDDNEWTSRTVIQANKTWIVIK